VCTSGLLFIFPMLYLLPTSYICILSLHGALPISRPCPAPRETSSPTPCRSPTSRSCAWTRHPIAPPSSPPRERPSSSRPRATSRDRKSTRLNSSHVKISYAVFCLKKKKHRYVDYD